MLEFFKILITENTKEAHMRYIIFFSLASILFAGNVSAEPVKVLFGGDVTLGKTYQSITQETRENPGFSFERLRSLIDSSDFLVINLENAVTSNGIPIPKKFNLSMQKEELSVLKAGRVNLVSLANNHTFDYGKRGLQETMEALTESGIPWIGAGNSLKEARHAHRVVLKGKRVSFLAYGNMNEHPEAEKFVAYRHTKNVVEDVMREKNEWAEFVIVFFHWGVERDTQPRQREITLAKMTIDAGADAIVGSHPHVPQPIKWYKGKPIAYSLGNFIFGGNRRGPEKGLLAEITLNDDNSVDMRGISIQICPQITRYQPHVIE